MKKHNITILGAGNLGLSIIKGLENSGLLENFKVTATKRHAEQLKGKISDEIDLTTDNLKAVEKAEYVFLCVQPKQLQELITEIKPVLNNQEHTIISVITAVTIADLEAQLGNDFAIIRAMPNTAISVMESMTCISSNKHGLAKLDLVKSIFNAVGKTLEIHEELMQAATVVCASGIAFWMRFIRATSQGGVQLGFDAADAQKIAVQTCLGAANLLNITGNHPEGEIDKVTTPQGCTIAGLNEMEHHGLSSALIKGLVTSFERINNMKSKQ